MKCLLHLYYINIRWDFDLDDDCKDALEFNAVISWH